MAHSAVRHLVFLLALAIVGLSTSAQAERRIALVIGNQSYKDAPLTNPVNDARAMAQSLRDVGFSVALLTDADLRTLVAALREFGSQLRGGGVGLFYYAGHGMQIKGRNYLIPIGADIQREDEVAYAALDAQAVLDKMEVAGNGTNLMILDACRNNPFARSFRSSVQGLAQMDAPLGTLIAFATSPGGVAIDGAGANGLYTQHLLAAMRGPGLKVEDVFKQVRVGVRRDSQGKQIPWETTSLEGDFYFVMPTPRDVDERAELAYWDGAKESHDAARLQGYLSQYPHGRFANDAQRLLGELLSNRPVPVAVVPVAPGPAGEPASSPIPATPGNLASHADASSKSSGTSTAFAVGDRWNYQVVDKFSGQVVRNFGRKVATVESDGSWATSDGSHFDQYGRLLWVQTADYRREWAPFAAGWWPDLKVGERRQFRWTYRKIFNDGKVEVWQYEAEANVRAFERITVPAGTFEAYAIEIVGTWTRKGVYGFGRLRDRIWYVPTLKTFAAFDSENPSAPAGNRERSELTSYELHDGSTAAR